MELSLTISATGSRFAPIVFQGDYDQWILEAASIGFRAVELHIRDPKAIDQQSILRSLQRGGITVSTIGTGQAYVDDRIFFTSPDEQIRRAAVQRLKDQVDFAAQIGARVIVGTIKGPLPEPESERAVARTRAADCLRECAEYAEKSGISFTLEAINRYETNFLNTAEETCRFIQEVGSPMVGLHLDTFHMNIEEASIEETLRKHAGKLVHIHLADSNRWPPGMGHLDFRSVLVSLRETGYQGYLGIECLPRPDARSAAEQAFQYIGDLLVSI
jgi:sugar phosphate isomerase/epimerase